MGYIRGSLSVPLITPSPNIFPERVHPFSELAPHNSTPGQPAKILANTLGKGIPRNPLLKPQMSIRRALTATPQSRWAPETTPPRGEINPKSGGKPPEAARATPQGRQITPWSRKADRRPPVYNKQGGTTPREYHTRTQHSFPRHRRARTTQRTASSISQPTQHIDQTDSHHSRKR